MMRRSKWGVPGALAVLLTAAGAVAQEVAQGAGPAAGGDSIRAVGLAGAAALTMALSVLGAAYAVGRVGSAAMGAAAEKPELLARSILFVALAEGLAVLGFAVAIMILQKA